MNFKRKIMSILLSAAMVSSLYVPFAYADDNVVYSYQNDAGETVNVTQSDIDAGHWNIDYMSHMPIEQYEDFPIMLETEVYGEAKLSLNATYLKTLGENDSAHFALTERGTTTELFSKNFAADDIVLNVAELPINKVINLVLEEIIDGEKKTYTSVIRTYYGEATMPENVSVYNIEHTLLGITAGRLRIKDLTLGTTEYEDENGEYAFDDHVTHMNPSDLPAFYQNISDDHLYSIQASTGEDIYKGFISKNSAYGCPYIFMPMYALYEDSFGVAALNDSTDSTPSDTTIYEKDYIDKKLLYYYSDVYMYLDHADWPVDEGDIDVEEKTSHRQLIQFFTYESGIHRIKTYSNIPTAGYYCIAESPFQDYTDFNDASWNAMGELSDSSSVNKVITIAEGYYLYLLIMTDTDTNNNGTVTCTIAYEGSSDSISNSKQEMNLSGATMTMNDTITSSIDYYSDVDVFKLGNTVTGKYSVILSNLNGSKRLVHSLYYC